ncbi:hybrid sensor histidine kinase/response regulator transcription factor [Flavobacterium sp. 2]|uniref:hybrid sensor histidine kinase/response regulator transcription factor n=1 Tax=Flavobacterium sp. 2 TaxID=308053 RepID=UPI003CEACDE5
MNNSKFLYLIILSYTFINAQNFPIRHLDISAGLSNNSVTSIYQDQTGYMWFGTFDGLNRFDGNDFKIYRNNRSEPNSISGDEILCIEGDEKSNLWIGTTNGVAIFNAERSSFVPLKYFKSSGEISPINTITYQILNIPEKKIKLVATKKMLIVYNKDEITGTPVTLNGKFNYFSRSLAYDRNKNIAYVFISGVGLCKYSLSSKKLKILNTEITIANCLKFTEQGLWIGTDDGAFLYNQSINRYSKNYFSSKKVVRDFLSEKSKMWIATDGSGLFILENNQKTPVPYIPDGPVSLLKSKSVWAVFESRNGEKWFGTLRGGVSMIGKDPFYFNHFKSSDFQSDKNDEDPANNFMLSFCEDEKKNIWIGTDGAGMRYWDRKKNTFSTYATNSVATNRIPSNFVTSIVRDSTNAIWVAMWKGGVSRIDTKTKSIKNFSIYNPYTKRAEPESWLLYIDSKQRLWLTVTNGGALYQYDKKLQKFICYNPALRDVTCLYETNDGKIWGGNQNLIIEIDPLTRKTKTFHVDYTVRCVIEDRNNNLWFGTAGGGLWSYNRKNNTLKKYTTKNGLSSNTVLRIFEDQNGNLWMSTYHGISRFDPQKKVFRNFSTSDGLQSNQFNWNAGTELSTGEFIFGGINGFNVFNPNDIKDKKNKGKFLLNELLVNNQPLKLNSSYITKKKLETIISVEIPYDKASIGFDYVYLDFVNSEKITTAYFLEGWDKQWNYTSKDNKANYSRLSEGTYFFKVKTIDITGKWSGEVVLITIKILPPWYRTWWAYMLYFTATAGLIFLYVRYNNNRERLRYEIKLTRMESKNEREIAEKQFSMFTYIAHELRTPLSLIINPLKAAVEKKNTNIEDVDLNLAYKNAKRLISMTDQLLLFRKAETDLDQLKIFKIDLNNLCSEVFSCFTEMALTKEINYNFIVSETTIEIFGDYEKIEITLFNLLSNAFKFTPKRGNISLEIKEDSSNAYIIISDTGIGIDQNEIENIFEKFKQVRSKSSNGFGIGLYVANYFVNKHHGEIYCKSELGKRTEFTVSLPKGNEHFAELPIYENIPQRSLLMDELVDGLNSTNQIPAVKDILSEIDHMQEELISTKKALLIVEDNLEMNQYLVQLFSKNYIVYSAKNGNDGLKLIEKHMPDAVLSDISMEGMSGLDLCRQIKGNDNFSHIPVILLTATTNSDVHLQSITEGADDYITKPFDSNILQARLDSVIRSRGQLRKYFLDSITLHENVNKVPSEYKEFMDKCIKIVEANIENNEFTLKTFCTAMGMSHSSLYKKIRAISGETANGFIRSIRLRKAALIMLTENINISQVGPMVGIEDQKHFRQQFVKLFGMKPSEYIKKYRNSFNKELNIIQKKDMS